MKLTLDDTGPIKIARLHDSDDPADSDSGQEQLHELVASRGSMLVLDLSNLGYIGSEGLNCLINVVTRANLGESRVILVSPTPFVAGVLEITKLDRWFEISPSVEDAIHRLERTAT